MHIKTMNPISEEKNLKTVCVTKRGQRYFVPKTIPGERDSMVRSYIALILVALTVHIYMTDDRSAIISLYIFTLFFYLSVILVHRLIIFIHERKHRLSRYENDYFKLINAAFTFNGPSRIVFIPCTLYIVYYISRHGWPSFQNEFWFIIAFLFFLDRILDLESNPINDSLDIAKDNGLDYGSGMAYSFFYGYLNYILPKTGDENKNLKELMQDYASTNSIKFEAYKIFILIPKSLTCPVSVADASNVMEMRKSLLEKKFTVAGVKDRVYKNSVYSIEHEKTKKKIYICTEYATPLKTFKDVVKNNTIHTEYYTRHRSDILLQFYLTLRQILEHERMNDLCELVFYEDMDKNGKYHDVGKILLNRIVEIKKEQNLHPKEN